MASAFPNTAVIARQQEFEPDHCNEPLCSQKARVGFCEKAVVYRSHHIRFRDIGLDRI